MKKEALLFLIVLLFVNLISAPYDCSSGAATKNGKIIYRGESKSVNGLEIAVIMSSWGGVAEMILDSKKITLTNASSSQEVELLAETYGISLINITDNYAWVNVEGNQKKLEVNSLEQAGGLQIYALNIAGTYPGASANLELLIGSTYAFIYEQNPSTIKTISGEEYGIEIPSSSNAEAFISVTTCQNGTLTKVDESVEGTTDQSDNSSSSNSSTTNQSSENSTLTQNTTQSDLDSENKDTSSSNSLSIIQDNFYIIIVVIIIMIILVLGAVLYLNYAHYKENPRTQNPPNQNSKQ